MKPFNWPRFKPRGQLSQSGSVSNNPPFSPILEKLGSLFSLRRAWVVIFDLAGKSIESLRAVPASDNSDIYEGFSTE